MSDTFAEDTVPGLASSRVIERLREIIPYREPLALILAATKPDEFWRWIDALPPAYSLELHALAATTPLVDHDFPTDTFTPYWQNFWVAYQVKTTSDPGFETPAAISQVSPRIIEELLEGNDTWTMQDNLWYVEGSPVGFELRLLVDICNSFIHDGNPWFFCPIDEIRCAYMDYDRILERISEPRSAVVAMQTKLRHFEYASLEHFLADVKSLGPTVPVSKLGEFATAPEIVRSLGELETAALQALKEDSGLPVVESIDDWTRTRADHLVAQLSLPIADRIGYSVTPQILRARTGQPAEAIFTRGSVAELLFSNSRGEIMPLPYTSCHSEIPTGSPAQYARAVLKGFVARQLMRHEYDRSTATVLDILTDVILFETRKIATTAATIKKGSAIDARSVVIQSLKNCGYDTYMLRTASIMVKR
jgi:hypothetical protein